MIDDIAFWILKLPIKERGLRIHEYANLVRNLYTVARTAAILILDRI